MKICNFCGASSNDKPFVKDVRLTEQIRKCCNECASKRVMSDRRKKETLLQALRKEERKIKRSAIIKPFEVAPKVDPQSLENIKGYYNILLDKKTEMETRHQKEMNEMNNLLIKADELRYNLGKTLYLQNRAA